MAKNGKVQKSGSSVGVALLGGLAAAAAAGAYFVYGNKDAQKKIKRVKGQVTSTVKGWALKAKAEALEKIEKLKQVDEAAYHSVIDTVMKKYNNVKNIDTKDVEAVAKELRSHWKNIQKEIKAASGVAKKTAKKVSKVAVKVAKEAKDAVSK
jgi:conjugal transfer/entry exclusion protein